jgi:hypothetical protein
MKAATIIAWAAIIGLFAGVIYGLNMNAVRAAEQKERIQAFSAKFHCQPEGYVATRNEPVRTYRCDNGLFVANDMKDTK